MMRNIHTTEQLKIALKSSEAHAKTYAVKYYNIPSNYRRQNEPGFLAISASPKKVKEAVMMLGVFLTRLIQQGVSIDLDSPGSFGRPSSALVLEGKHFPLRIKEIFAYQEVKHGHRTSTEKGPTGRFVIELYRCGSFKPAKTLTANTEEEMPYKADSILLYMKAEVEYDKAHREENERKWREWEEAERRRQEKERMLEERADMAKAVIEDIRLFERAETMRKFCDIAEQRSTSEDYKKVIAIARSVADWIDPTTDYTDTILAARYSASDFI
ncbi:MAG: hypothetical protein J6X25_01045 [Bacteroidales bacterium]|nr:hypothetical protein [Bacteroidales bacterium]